VPPPSPVSPEKLTRKTAVKPAPVVTETIYQVAEVREMYENPGPFSKRAERAPTFEEHLQRIYLTQGFLLEERAGKQVLVLKTSEL
jgi:hypothetical protein